MDFFAPFSFSFLDLSLSLFFSSLFFSFPFLYVLYFPLPCRSSNDDQNEYFEERKGAYPRCIGAQITIKIR